MDFTSPKPIFLQICDMIIDQILGNKLENGMRILSVREMGGEISVNPNTVQRAYVELQQSGIIEQKRGIGYFVSHNGQELAKKFRRDEFTKVQMPLLLHQMRTLDLSWEDLKHIEKTIELKE